MFFKRMTGTGASPASADGDSAVPSSAAARSGEIRARHGAGSVAPPSSFSNNDGEDSDGGRRAGGGSSSSSLNDADASAAAAQQHQQHQQQQHRSSPFSRLAAALGTGAGTLLTLLVCLSWMGVSSVLILLNKHLLASGFHYPMALSCLGMAFSSIAAFFCCRVTGIVEARRNAFTPREYVAKVVPGEWRGSSIWRERGKGKRKTGKNNNAHSLLSLLSPHQNLTNQNFKKKN